MRFFTFRYEFGPIGSGSSRAKRDLGNSPPILVSTETATTRRLTLFRRFDIFTLNSFSRHVHP